MKRSREVREEGYDSEEPLSETEPDLEQSAAAESDGKGNAQPPPEADTDVKRSKLQKKLKKLKQTYENRGGHLKECVLAFLQRGDNGQLLTVWSRAGIIYISRIPPHLVRKPPQPLQ